MPLIVARCWRVRLLVLKSDGSVMVHSDSGGYKPLNCA